VRDLPYFAYGSFMYSRELHLHCPKARSLGRARLAAYRLDFTAYALHRQGGEADIVPIDLHDSRLDYEQRGPGEQEPYPLTPVWGVLWQVPEAERDELDRAEGYFPGRPAEESLYRPAAVHVLHHGAEVNHMVEAFTYEVVDKQPHIPPNERYLDLLIAGAREHDLPAEYVMELTRVARFEPL
jgi:hypothetical protein